MLILGIESSCDETGIAIYDSEKGLLGHAIQSQINVHSEYGGVVPELASRDHIKNVIPLIEKVLFENELNLHNLDAIAYTKGPGLAGALLVGTSISNALGMSLKKPVIEVNHLEGHILSTFLSDKPEFPFLSLLVSGGHTQLIQVDDIGIYNCIGETLDDAAGEAFDKSAQLLNLGFPGGAELSKLAETGESGIFNLPRPMIYSKNLNFSFSGLKTAFLILVKKNKNMSEQTKANIARAFVDAVVEILITKSLKALNLYGLNQIVVVGGVGANKQLRNFFLAESKKKKFKIFFPKTEFCTDNGAMIALAGALKLKKNPNIAKFNYSMDINPRWNI